jgi:hypothetical protein
MSVIGSDDQLIHAYDQTIGSCWASPLAENPLGQFLNFFHELTQYMLRDDFGGSNSPYMVHDILLLVLGANQHIVWHCHQMYLILARDKLEISMHSNGIHASLMLTLGIQRKCPILNFHVGRICRRGGVDTIIDHLYTFPPVSDAYMELLYPRDNLLSPNYTN